MIIPITVIILLVNDINTAMSIVFGYLGSLIGASITIFAVILTFKYQRVLNDHEHTLLLKPRFCVTAIQDRKDLYPQIPIMVDELYLIEDAQTSSSEGHIGLGRVGYTIENIGLGNAIEVIVRITTKCSVSIKKSVIFDSVKTNQAIQTISDVYLAQEHIDKYDVYEIQDDHELRGFLNTLRIEYKDLHEKAYYQNIMIRFVVAKKACEKAVISVHLDVLEISSPKEMVIHEK